MQNSKKNGNYLPVKKIGIDYIKPNRKKPYVFTIARIMPSAYTAEERKKLKEFEIEILGDEIHLK